MRPEPIPAAACERLLAELTSSESALRRRWASIKALAFARVGRSLAPVLEVAARTPVREWSPYLGAAIRQTAEWERPIAPVLAACVERVITLPPTRRLERAVAIGNVLLALRRGESTPAATAQLEVLAGRALDDDSAAILAPYHAGAGRWDAARALLGSSDPALVIAALQGLYGMALRPIVPTLRTLAADMQREPIAHAAGRTLYSHARVTQDWESLRWVLTEAPEYVVQAAAGSYDPTQRFAAPDDAALTHVVEHIGGKTAPDDFLSFLAGHGVALAGCSALARQVEALPVGPYIRRPREEVVRQLQAVFRLARLPDSAALDELRGMLASSSSATRRGVVYALWGHADRGALPRPLVEALAEGVASEALDDFAVEALTHSATHEGPEALARVLALAEPVELAGAVFEALTDSIAAGESLDLVESAIVDAASASDELRELASATIVAIAATSEERAGRLATALETRGAHGRALAGYCRAAMEDALLGRERWQEHADRCAAAGLSDDAAYAQRVAATQPPDALLDAPLGDYGGAWPEPA